jgi:hypothetical protein
MPRDGAITFRDIVSKLTILRFRRSARRSRIKRYSLAMSMLVQLAGMDPSDKKLMRSLADALWLTEDDYRGRKRKLSEYQRAEAIRRRDAGETIVSIAKSYAVGSSNDLKVAVMNDEKLWSVYALSDPRDGQFFYIGCPSRVEQRRKAHEAGDRGVGWGFAAWHVTELRAEGLRPEFAVLESWNDRAAALRRESMLIETNTGR